MRTDASGNTIYPESYRTEGPEGGPAVDMVNHPPHYTSHPSGVECITVVEHMPMNIGNAVKYIWRADKKGAPVEDLKKALWYTERESARRLALRNRTDAWKWVNPLAHGLHPAGLLSQDIAKHMSYNLGSAFTHLWAACHDSGTPEMTIPELAEAAFYIKLEIDLRTVTVK